MLEIHLDVCGEQLRISTGKIEDEDDQGVVQNMEVQIEQSLSALRGCGGGEGWSLMISLDNEGDSFRLNTLAAGGRCLSTN